MTDHQGQIIVAATMTAILVFVSSVIFFSMTYGATDVMDDDAFATALSAQI